jgi:hypothetical protein
LKVDEELDEGIVPRVIFATNWVPKFAFYTFC